VISLKLLKWQQGEKSVSLIVVDSKFKPDELWILLSQAF